MATSNVEIANRALAKLKVSQIQSFTENTVESRAATLVFDEARQFVLSRGGWSWATKRVKLARLTAAPAFGYSYVYARPSDFLRFRDLFTDSSGSYKLTDYRPETDGIVCNAEEVYAVYIYDVQDPNKMSADFRSALEDYLAYNLALKIPASKSLSSDHLERFERVSLPRALSAEGVDDVQDGWPESDWISGREAG